jgi:CNT family concentrative nucleoside transporter
MSVLYHLGIIQFVVKWIAKAMQKTMGTSGSETLSVSANIFVGQTEAPLMVRPFISKMTHSELMAVMVGGFATVAGGVLAIYVKWLTDIPGIAGHLLAASVMSAPAALVIAKIIYPETEDSETMGDLKIEVERTSSNAMEALGNGASDGLKLAANVAAMLVAFISIVAMVNYLLGFAGTSIDQILGLIFQPLAWTMGVPWEESALMGTLMGKKIAFTELIAYGDLKGIMASGQISERTAIIASYALCGFANFGSIGIQLGGIGAMAPERKKDLAALVSKAMIGGALASWLTATVAGILI